MPEKVKLEKAELRELDARGQPTGDRTNWTTVQFNPETLKVSFANQVVPPANSAGSGDQRGNSAIQYVGKGTTKLAVQLWFDVTGVLPSDQQNVDDVQQLTKKVIYYITPRPDQRDPNKFLPPGISFIWGTFQFDGIVESLEESLEYFSSDGKPLRASITMNLTKQEIAMTIRTPDRQGQPVAGTQPLTQARAGQTVQGLASSTGQGSNWQGIAQANGIENPRQLAPGQLINLNPPSLR